MSQELVNLLRKALRMPWEVNLAITRELAIVAIDCNDS